MRNDKQAEYFNNYVKSKQKMERDSYRSYMYNVKKHKEIMNGFYGKSTCKGNFKNELFQTLNPIQRKRRSEDKLKKPTQSRSPDLFAHTAIDDDGGMDSSRPYHNNSVSKSQENMYVNKLDRKTLQNAQRQNFSRMVMMD